jgi:hypothetical protein
MRIIFIIYIILYIAFSTDVATGQAPKKDTPLVLEKLFDRLVDNYDDSVRIHINDSIRLIIDNYVRSDSVFSHRFTNLRYLGQIMSPDSLLKIITWNLVLENEPGRFFCYFIRKQESREKNIIYRLSSAYRENPVMTDTIYSESDWYGALYYDLKPYITQDKHSWVLLGIDYGNPFISRKIIEVLSFKPDNSIVFGRKWFTSGEGKNYRVVFEYASNAMMSLRFRSDSSIVFDHLVPFSAVHKDNRQYYGPDYSFDAYNLENGLWRLIINVDARNTK